MVSGMQGRQFARVWSVRGCMMNQAVEQFRILVCGSVMFSWAYIHAIRMCMCVCLSACLPVCLSICLPLSVCACLMRGKGIPTAGNRLPDTASCTILGICHPTRAELHNLQILVMLSEAVTQCRTNSAGSMEISRSSTKHTKLQHLLAGRCLDDFLLKYRFPAKICKGMSKKENLNAPPNCATDKVAWHPRGYECASFVGFFVGWKYTIQINHKRTFRTSLRSLKPFMTASKRSARPFVSQPSAESAAFLFRRPFQGCLE